MLIAQTSAGVAVRRPDGYALLDLGGASLEELIRAEQLETAKTARTRAVVAADAVVVLPPIRRPGKVCIVGLNYSDHAREINSPVPVQVRFNYTVGSAVIGPHDDIVLPDFAPAQVDYEGELALIVGRTAHDVPEESAWEHVAGVTAANDVSARDVQLGRGAHVAGSNVGVAKGFDSFKPMGPALLTADELTPDTPLKIRTIVDGAVRQESSTANLVFGVSQLVSAISRYTTLEPGDAILTGTPGGVALTTGQYLTEGQIVEVELERVGCLRNQVVRRP